MRKIIYFLMALSLISPNLIYANTQTPAKDITVNTTDFSKNLNSSDNTVQKALNTIDQLSTSGGGTPGGVDTQFQINNGGNFGGGNMYNVSGNVGINSTNPGAQLDVSGGIRTSGFQLTSGSNLANKVLVSDANGNGTWQTNSAGSGTVNPGLAGQFSYYPDAAAAVSGQSSLYYNSSGNIGIGTPNPVQQLEVLGTIRALGYSGPGIIFGLTSGKIPKAASSTVLSDSVMTELSGNIGMGTDIPMQKLDVAGTIKSTGSIIGSLSGILKGTAGTVGVATSGTDYAPATSGSSILMGNGAGGFSNAVAGTNYEVPLTFSTGLTRTINTVVVNNSQNIVQLSNLTSNGLVTTSGSNGTLSITPISSISGLWAQGPVGINTTVNVGIGSASPSQILDVAGTARAQGFQGSSAGQMNISTNQGIGIDPVNNTYTTPKLVLNTSGNVGVNTTTAPSQLYVAGQAEMTGFKLDGNGVSSGYVMQTNSVGVGTWVSASSIGAGGGTPGGSAFQLQYNNSGAFGGVSGSGVVGGNVGIGSVNPEYSLVATNGAKITGTGPSSFGSNVGIGTTIPSEALTINGSVGIGTANSSFTTTAAPSGGLIVENNVGIGSVNPTQALDVAGSINSTGAGVFSGALSTGSTLSTVSAATIGNTSGGSGTLTANSNSSSSTVGSNETLIMRNNDINNNNMSTIAFKDNGTTNAQTTTFISGIGTSHGASPSADLAFGTSNSGAAAEVLRIKGNGNVGIGTLIPPNLLYVAGTMESQGFKLNQNPVAGYALITNSVGVGTWAQLPPGGTGTVTSIGASSPNGTIQVGSTPVTTSGTITYDVNWTNINGIGAINNGGINWFDVNRVAKINSGGVNWNSLNNSEIQRQAINWPSANISVSGATGNVGVGTINPQYLFQVNGNVGIGTALVGGTPAYNMTVNNVVTFGQEYTYASNIGVGTTTINWNNGNYQNIGIGTSQGAYLAFTHPTNGGVAKLQLRVKQDATGSRIISFYPATVLWAGGTAPTLTTTGGKSDIINCTWNGTNDYCASTLNF